MCWEQPDAVPADAGYGNDQDMANLEMRSVGRSVSPGREGTAATARDPQNHPATRRMVKKLATPAGRSAYAEHTWLSEAPNGWITHVLGFWYFGLRGIAKARGAWGLVCVALNVRHL